MRGVRELRPGMGVLRVVARASLLILVATCQVDKLTNNPPPVATLSLEPSQVRDSAAVGSTAVDGDSLAVINTGPGTLSWSARLVMGGSWLAFIGPTSGTAPAKLRLAFSPAGLATGVYRDTVFVSAENAAGSPGRVPVEFVVHPCMPVAIVPDVQVSDSITTRDCAAPHRGASFARLYSFTAPAGDSIAVFMSSTALDAYVALDTSLTGPTLAQNDTCGSGSDACLPYQRLPATQTYLIEAAAGAGQTGAFRLSVTRPRSPSGLGQFQSDGSTPIAVGGSATSPSVLFRGTVADPGLGAQLRLEVEVKPVGAAFDGHASGTGTAVANGAVASAVVAGLSGNTAYHWQARAVDQTGRGGLWGSFGSNAETAVDFRLAGVATQIVVNAGNNQTITAGTIVPVPPSVVVRDAGGNPVPGVAVTFAVAPGNGSITGASQTTNASGIATVGSWTLSATAGTNTLTATSGTLSGSPVTFTATGTAGNAGSIAVNAGNNQTATANTAVTTPPSVIVRDANGNPVSGVSVTFAVASGSGGITGGSQTTNASGIATVGSWTLGTAAGANTLTATAPGLNGSPVTFTATAAAGAPSAERSHVAANPTTITASSGSSAATVTVTVNDQFGNPVSGATVTLAVAPTTGNTLTQPAGPTPASGQITGTLSSTRAETKTVTATVNGETIVTETATVTVNAGPAATIALSAGNNQTITAGTAVPVAPSVIVTDASGNPVSGVAVAFAVATGGGTVNPTAPVTTTAGGLAAVTSWTLGTSAGVNTLTATASGLTGSPVTFTATGTAGNAGSIAVNAGNGQTATVNTAVATAPSVVVRDANGNPVSGVSVTFAAAAGSGSITGATQTTGASGIATVGSWTLGTAAGANTLTATSPGLNGSPVTFTATGTAGAPSAGQSLVSAAPGTITASSGTSTSTITVTVRDQFMNPVSGATVTLAAAPTAGNTLTQPVGTTPASGQITGTLSSTAAGAKTVTATVNGTLAVTPTATVTVTAAAASAIAVSAGNNQTATAGTAVTTPPAVIVRDAFNNPVAGVAVTFAVASGGGSVTPTTPVTTGANGIAAVTSWTLGATAGPNTLTATSGTLSGSPVTFTATGTAGAAGSIALNAGNGPSATVGTAVAVDPSVIVRDANSNPVAGVAVTFAVASGGGTVAPTTPVTTGANGIATVTSWTLGTTVGPNTLTATAS